MAHHDVRLFDDRLAAARVNDRQTAPLDRTGHFARLAAMPRGTGAKKAHVRRCVPACHACSRGQPAGSPLRSDLAGAR